MLIIVLHAPNRVEAGASITIRVDGLVPGDEYTSRTNLAWAITQLSGPTVSLSPTSGTGPQAVSMTVPADATYGDTITLRLSGSYMAESDSVDVSLEVIPLIDSSLLELSADLPDDFLLMPSSNWSFILTASSVAGLSTLDEQAILLALDPARFTLTVRAAGGDGLDHTIPIVVERIAADKFVVHLFQSPARDDILTAGENVLAEMSGTLAELGLQFQAAAIEEIWIVDNGMRRSRLHRTWWSHDSGSRRVVLGAEASALVSQGTVKRFHVKYAYLDPESAVGWFRDIMTGSLVEDDVFSRRATLTLGYGTADVYARYEFRDYHLQRTILRWNVTLASDVQAQPYYHVWTRQPDGSALLRERYNGIMRA